MRGCCASECVARLTPSLPVRDTHLRMPVGGRWPKLSQTTTTLYPSSFAPGRAPPERRASAAAGARTPRPSLEGDCSARGCWQDRWRDCMMHTLYPFLEALIPAGVGENRDRGSSSVAQTVRAVCATATTGALVLDLAFVLVLTFRIKLTS